MFNNQIIAGSSGQGGSFYSYTIDQSLRLQNGVSQNLTVSSAFPTATDRKKVTVSFWYKRSLGSSNAEFPYYAGGNGLIIQFNTNGTMYLYDFGAGSGGWQITSSTTDRLHRDTSAYYHFALILDSTQATASDRAKLYVNGELWSFSNWSVGGGASRYPTLNASFNAHTGSSAKVLTTGTSGLNGYVADFMSIDGQDVTIDDLGETVNGVWVAKEYTGSFGNAGFHLDFADSSAIGNDVSGNNVDFTADSGFAAHDVVSDSPTNNFPTLNRVHPNASTGNFSEGNLRSYQDQSPYTDFYATFAVSSGKWYWEARAAGTAVQQIWGFAREDALTTSNGGAAAGSTGYAYFRYGNIARERANGSNVNSSSTLSVAAGDIIGLALNLDDNEVKFYKNGTLEHTITGVQDGTYYPFVCYQMNQNRLEQRVNFGQDSTFAGLETAGGNSDGNGVGDFAQSVISGHLAICSANLPEPDIGPNSGVGEQSDDYFNTVLWSGNSTNNRSITTGHATDWIWIKKRGTTVQSHVIADSVRGTSDNGGTGNVGILASNSSDAESTNSSDSGIASFDSAGFTIGAGSNTANADAPYQGTNASGHTYVGWSWKAGGTAVSNTDGGTTSSVSANTGAGFSILTYTADAATGTVGHGLDSAPELIIGKPRASSNWFVMETNVLSANQVLNLDATSAAYNPGVNHFNDTFPTSTVVSYGGYMGNSLSNDNKLMYCFHSVEGYSKVGSYVGNGNADGAFVFTGFRPAFLLVRAVGKAAGWHIFDNKRAFEGNEIDVRLEADNTDAENTSGPPHIDFLSNGFKLRTSFDNINHSGGNHIYLAFAEAPFKYANAR